MAERAAHVTMLQRSPSYVVSLPGRTRSPTSCAASFPRRSPIPIVRWKNVLLADALLPRSAGAAPKFMKALIRKGVERRLPAGYDVDTHFKPRYNPWDQRVCLVPDGDLFQAIRKGERVGGHRPHRDASPRRG